MQIHDKTFEVLIEKDEITARIVSLSAKINLEYAGKKPLFIAVLNGSFMFAADLFKNLKLNAEISFIKVQSYQKTESQGIVNEVIGLTETIENREIIILEDIVDTGLTIKKVIQFLEDKKPKSIKIATLLFKPKALKVALKPDYYCFEIEPKFVVGFGLDYDGLGRNLQDIWVLKK